MIKYKAQFKIEPIDLRIIEAYRGSPIAFISDMTRKKNQAVTIANNAIINMMSK